MGKLKGNLAAAVAFACFAMPGLGAAAPGAHHVCNKPGEARFYEIPNCGGETDGHNWDVCASSPGAMTDRILNTDYKSAYVIKTGECLNLIDARSTVKCNA